MSIKEKEGEEKPFSLGKGCTILQETNAAILITSPARGLRIWVPSSVVHDNSEIWSKHQGGEGEGSVGELIVHLWWARKQPWGAKAL
jgi:hypothetical protein